MDALDSFIARVAAAAVKVGDTSANFGQCVGLVEVWFDTQLEPHIWGNAKDLYANATDGFTKGTSWPAPKGAAGVMDGSWGGGVGHTWISLGDGRVFEQNNPTGHVPKVSNFGATPPAGYIGWIRPNNFKGDTAVTGSQAICDETTIRLCYNGILFRDPQGDEWKVHNNGQTVESLMRSFINSPEHAALAAKLATPASAADAKLAALKAALADILK